MIEGKGSLVQVQKECMTDRMKTHLTLPNVLLVVAWLTCALCGAFPGLNTLLSMVFLCCILGCWKSNEFFCFIGLFVFFREWMLIGGAATTVYRIYSYLMVLRFITDIRNAKIRISYLPALLVFTVYLLFAVGKINMRFGLNMLADVLAIYIALTYIQQAPHGMSKLLFVMVFGAIASGIFGWTAEAMVVINVGDGSTQITRYYGAINDANFAGFFYVVCGITVMHLKMSRIIRVVLIGLFVFLLLQTTSLSAITLLIVTMLVWVILRFKSKAFLILFGILIFAALATTAIWTIPALNSIPELHSLIARINEKFVFLQAGQWELFTTDRLMIWKNAIRYFNDSSLLVKLFGGRVITLFYADKAALGGLTTHQSNLQSIIDFGILGSIVVYGSFFAIWISRIVRYFVSPEKLEEEPYRRLEILYMAMFFIFGLTVDFFLDWRYLLFFFI